MKPRRIRMMNCPYCNYATRVQPKQRGEVHTSLCGHCCRCNIVGDTWLQDAANCTYNQDPKSTGANSVANQSVVVYYNDTKHTPTAPKVEKLREHFKLDVMTMGNARKMHIAPHGQLFITDQHATSQAHAAGAAYMGWEYACRIVGLQP